MNANRQIGSVSYIKKLAGGGSLIPLVSANRQFERWTKKVTLYSFFLHTLVQMPLEMGFICK